MNDENIEINVPDSLEGVITARDYRKQAQEDAFKTLGLLMCSLEATKGRPGLTDAEKILLMEHFSEHMAEIIPLLQSAQTAMGHALEIAKSS